jgi:uncharacterized protein YecE (DUF72 family)
MLGRKVGPVLFQLPPQFKKNRERLASFFKLASPNRTYAFEFRHPSWYDDDILDLLRDNNVALCISDHHDAPSPWTVTARHVYLRGHGPGGRYLGHYPVATLQSWALGWQRVALAYRAGPSSLAAVERVRRVQPWVWPPVREMAGLGGAGLSILTACDRNVLQLSFLPQICSRR